MTTIINNENKKLNVPNLRFPEFQGEWEKKTIGEISTIKNGPFGSVLHAEDYVDEGMPIVTTEHFKNGNLPLSKNGIPQVSEDDYHRLRGYTLEKDDIVFSRVGSIDINAHVEQSQQGWLFSGRVLRVRPIKSVNSLCLHFILSTESVKRSIRNRAVGQTMPSINTPILSNTKINIPQSVVEQKKIASLLALLDERIATQNKIIEDLKKLKSAISKLLFAQKPNGWNRLDTLFSKGKAGGTPTSTNKEYYNGEIPFLSINDITKQGKYVRCTEIYLSQSGLENSSAWVVPKKSLIMSMYASVGLVTINEMPLATSQAMFAMQLKDKALLDYLYYYLSYFKYRYIHKYLETGTQSNINADIVRGIMIPTYGYSHNIEIASTLQGVDAKIDNELSVQELLHRQKNYFLSQMFI